jgi:hypothetical protein
MLYILKISLVTFIFKLNSLKSATKAINLTSFKEIQLQIILVWNVGLYLNTISIFFFFKFFYVGPSHRQKLCTIFNEAFP